jgi:hypothetical protein
MRANSAVRFHTGVAGEMYEGESLDGTAIPAGKTEVAGARRFRNRSERQRICGVDQSTCPHAAARVVHCARKRYDDFVYVRRAPLTQGL